MAWSTLEFSVVGQLNTPVLPVSFSDKVLSLYVILCLTSVSQDCYVL